MATAATAMTADTAAHRTPIRHLIRRPESRCTTNIHAAATGATTWSQYIVSRSAGSRTPSITPPISTRVSATPVASSTIDATKVAMPAAIARGLGRLATFLQWMIPKTIVGTTIAKPSTRWTRKFHR